MDFKAVMDSMVNVQVAAVRAGYETREKEVEELVSMLRCMTSNFKMSLLLISDPDTRALGMSILRDAQKLLSRYPRETK